MVSIYVLTLGVMAMVSTTYSNPASDIKSNEDWPKACLGKYYCWEKSATYNNLYTTFEKVLKDEMNVSYVVGNEIDDRQGITSGVGHCMLKERGTIRIYMIRDETNRIWYVPQTEHYDVRVQIRECVKPDFRINDAQYLDPHELNNAKLQCTEQKVNLNFPVLSINKKTNKLELSARSPHKGLPVYCSAKVVK